MKKIISTGIYLLLGLLPVMATAQQYFTIKGRIGNLNAPATIYLRWMLPSGDQQIDSAVLKNGAFTFRDTLANPYNAYLELKEKGPAQKNGIYKGIYLEPMLITITGDSLQNAIVKGGKETKAFAEFQVAMQPMNERWRDSGKVAMQIADKELRNAAFIRHSISYQQEEKNIYAAFIRSHPDCYVSLNLLRGNYGKYPPLEEVGPLFKQLSPAMRQTAKGKAYGKMIALWERTNIGRTAPDFTQKDSSGKTVSLHDYKGRYVLLNFWATYCGPCLMEKPHMRKIYAAYNKKPFDILDISLTDQTGHNYGDRDKWVKMLRNMKLPWANVYGDEARELYGVEATPSNYLVSPEGEIIAKNIHGQELDQLLAKLLP
ncbi:MAG: AhpC/TSA family protein [Filimonas sp.]|nr:AhpC/TSA family protein [Filimonas sp.]